MSRERLALLSDDAWKARLSDLLHDCAASAPAEQADRIREAQRLLRSPACPAGQRGLERMLAFGAYESAVLSVIGSDTAFMLSQGANGNCLASVVLPDGSDEMVAEGSTLALALLVAYLSSLIAGGDPYLEDLAEFEIDVARRLH